MINNSVATPVMDFNNPYVQFHEIIISIELSRITWTEIYCWLGIKI